MKKLKNIQQPLQADSRRVRINESNSGSENDDKISFTELLAIEHQKLIDERKSKKSKKDVKFGDKRKSIQSMAIRRRDKEALSELIPTQRY